MTTFKTYSDELYITAEDALILSGYSSYGEDYGKIVFTYGLHQVTFQDGQISIGDTFYYPLQKLMDALSTSYYYDDNANVLIFITCKSYYENLLADCHTVFDDGYELEFYEGTGWQVAAVYEIFDGMIFSSLWNFYNGSYQREWYEDTLSGIVADTDSDFTATLKEGSSVMSKLNTLLKFSQKDINEVDTYVELLGTDLDGFIEAFGKLNKLIPGISVNDAIEILDYLFLSTDIANTYPNAIKYGLVENSYLDDKNLTIAANKVYTLYDENKSILSNIAFDILESVINSKGEDVADAYQSAFVTKIVNNLAGVNYTKTILNNAYVKLEKLFFDEILGAKKPVTAAIQTVAARNIQRAAELQFELNNGETSYIVYGDGTSFKGQDVPNAMRVKYSTILYLRACQYAYSLYEFDDTLNWATEYWHEKTEKAISKISDYADEELTQTINNEPLQIENFRDLDAVDNSFYTLPDGEYYVELYRDGTTLVAGVPFESVGILEFVEIDNNTAMHMAVGDVIELPKFNITISALELHEGDVYKEFWINNGEYRCCYIEETNSWRFAWPNDVAMTYCSGTYTISVPAPTIIDMNTAFSIGQNIYGDKYNGETSRDAPIFRIYSMSDYFSYHKCETEYAIITITNGVITEILIPYRP